MDGSNVDPYFRIAAVCGKSLDLHLSWVSSSAKNMPRALWSLVHLILLRMWTKVQPQPWKVLYRQDSMDYQQTVLRPLQENGWLSQAPYPFQMIRPLSWYLVVRQFPRFGCLLFKLTYDIWENYRKAVPRNRYTMEPFLNSTSTWVNAPSILEKVVSRSRKMLERKLAVA